MRTKRTFKLLICACIASLSYCVTAQEPVLQITGGKVQGVKTTTEGVLLYKGIPFAAPPTGDLRWKAPQPVVPWMGVLKADKFGPAAIQSDRDPNAKVPDGVIDYVKEFYAEGDPTRSEDCLYLNVWTPASGKTDAKLPVAIWIHGGAFSGGFGYEKEFDGDAYALRGVILVTINYRLGLLGFAAHPALSKESERSVSGNYGLLDQIAALDWVRDNIRQFGGDPDNITIFGQSAGAMSVRCLAASPLTKGKIKRAIIQSGGGLNAIDPVETVADYEKMGMEIFGNKSAEELKALSFNDIQRLYMEWMKKQKGFKLVSPIIDQYVLTKNFSDLAKEGKLPDISYMLGGTENDMEIFKTGQSHYDFSLELIKHGQKPAYIYHFARPLPGDNCGSFHSSELWYVFGTLKRCWRPFVAADYDLSNTMLDYWTNFMKTGDPNEQGLNEWAPYTKEKTFVMCFDINP
uniref:carboxylesterase/lipase family protein n=1 Tax=Parabacteroides distasonis TaxID=823 RepID=UPI0040267890